MNAEQLEKHVVERAKEAVSRFDSLRGADRHYIEELVQRMIRINPEAELTPQFLEKYVIDYVRQHPVAKPE